MPKSIDYNAANKQRLRRNAQRTKLAQSTGSVTLDPAGGLETTSSGLRINLNGSSLTVGTLGLSLTDGDKGDITVSSTGTVFTIDNDAVTFAKMQNINTDRLLGRVSAGIGDVEEVVCTDFAQGLLDDVDAVAARTTLGLGTIATESTPLAVTVGGTGLTSLAQGDIIYGSASNTFSALAKNTSASRYLSNTGTGNAPAWAQVNLANGVTGTLPLANGGTGAALVDPGADRIVFWDESAGAVTFLTAGDGLVITGTTIAVSLASNSGLEFSTGALRIKLDTNPALALGSGGVSVKRDGDSIQLDGSGNLEVRKMRNRSSDPASPAVGEMWNNTSINTPRFRSNVAKENFVGMIWDGLGTRANGDNVGASTTSEVIFTKDAGASNVSYTFGANTMRAGDLYQIFFGCRYNSGTSQNVRIRIRLGGISGPTIWDTGNIATGGAQSNQVVACMAQFRVLDSSNIRAMGLGAYGTPTATPVYTLTAVSTNTTATQELVATVQFSASNGSNLCFCSQFNICRLGSSPN